MGVRIKDAAQVGSLGENYKIPISDGSNQPKSATVKQISSSAAKDAFIEGKIKENRNIFSSWETETKKDLEYFILSLKISSPIYDTDEKREEFYNGAMISNISIYDTSVRINIKTAANKWILYNQDIPIGEGIQFLRKESGYHTLDFVINWDYKPSGNINLASKGVMSDNYKQPYSVLEKGELDDVIPSAIVLENLLYRHFNVKDESIVDTITNKGYFTITYDNGLHIVAQGYTGKYEASTPQLDGGRIKSLVHGHKYALYYDMEYTDDVLLHPSDVFVLQITKYGLITDFGFKNDGYYIPNKRVKGCSTAYITTDSSTEVYNIILKFVKHNNTKTTDKILDVKFNSLMLVDVTHPSLINKSDTELRTLFDSVGTFDKLVLSNYTPDTLMNSLYKGMILRSLGDSLPETVSFQPYIAQCFGMEYDSSIELKTEDIDWNGETVKRWASVIGGTRVTPVVTSYSTSSTLQSGYSIYMRAKSLKYNAPDVLLILAGYNDPVAGSAYIQGGTATQPSDYGINDAPYLGDEIDLVADPTASVPSFGACYRGMIENILTDMPYCRIVLCGVPRGNGEAGKYGKDNDWNSKKNEVIEKIAKEYGFPYVNLADVYGVNKFNVNYLTKDNLHFSGFGGRRVAMEIIAKAF